MEEHVVEQDDIQEEVVEETFDSEESELDDLEKYFSMSDDEDEEPEEEVAEEPEEEVVPEVIEEPAPEEKLFTQAEVNKIVGNARIKGREIEEPARMIEQLTGMPLNMVSKQLRDQLVEGYENEYGMPRDEAEKIIAEREKLQYLEPQLMQIHQQQALMQYQLSYNQSKAQAVAAKPHIKPHIAEIDAIVQDSWQRGQPVDFETAARYVIGGKAYEGALQQSVKEAAQQNTLKNVSKRPMVSPEGSGSGGAATRTVPPELKRMAAMFGNDPNSVAKEYQKIKRGR